MMISTSIFSIMITVALAITALSPVILLTLWVLDLKRGKLW